MTVSPLFMNLHVIVSTESHLVCLDCNVSKIMLQAHFALFFHPWQLFPILGFGSVAINGQSIEK